MNLSGRVAAVTGGAGKIGTAICEALAELGASVCIVDIAERPAANLATRLNQEYGVNCSCVSTDLEEETAVLAMTEHIASVHGRLDVLINNAAYPPTDLPADGRSLEEQSLARWEKNLRVMLTGTFLATRACVPMLRASQSAAIVNIGSIYGMIGPDFGLYAGTEMQNPAFYAASKGGILQLTRYWATTLAPTIRVNCIAPGGIWRDQPQSFVDLYNRRTPLGRMGEEEDLKGAIGFFASDLSAYVTGQVLAVDGGFTAW
jgi:NAD(P)-dependent dehydrogenase (short-subunit alcohol dehydrogenase family)